MSDDTVWYLIFGVIGFFVFRSLSGGAGMSPGQRTGVKMIKYFQKAKLYAQADAANEVLKESAKKSGLREIREAVGDIAESAPIAAPAPSPNS